MFDWERQMLSADPEYYKWTQWFFIQLFKMGLAYRKKAAVDWCPKDNTTLAREQVIGDDRVCERCGTPVIKKDLEQWFFKTTKYADELLDFSQIDWPQTVQTLQTNWIGRSEGAEVQFQYISDQYADAQRASSAADPQLMTVFTTRPGYAVGRDLHGLFAGTSAGGSDHDAGTERPRWRPIRNRRRGNRISSARR